MDYLFNDKGDLLIQKEGMTLTETRREDGAYLYLGKFKIVYIVKADGYTAKVNQANVPEIIKLKILLLT